MSTKDLVLVTGGSGFLGSHCIIQCLAAGYLVRTTIRSLHRKDEVLSMLKLGNAQNIQNLTFTSADLTKDEGWAEAVADAKYVLHVASPFPPAEPKHEDELIIPAREGTLRVLRAARDAGVSRVVITSSMAAVTEGHTSDANAPFDESFWSKLDGGLGAYPKSKTLAERAAWEFIKEEGGGMELAVINPCLIVGPVLAPDTSSSIEAISRLMNGAVPGCPNLNWGLVDVRDVAAMHLLAMTNEKAAGERFICMAPPAMSMKEMSLALREGLGAKAKRCPTWSIPDFVVKGLALFDPSVALIVPMLGQQTFANVNKAKEVLGWTPRSAFDAVVATGESLWNLGLVKK